MLAQSLVEPAGLASSAACSEFRLRAHRQSALGGSSQWRIDVTKPAKNTICLWFAVLLGFIEAISPAAALAALPIAVWEFSLGVYLTFWGFTPSPITAGM